VPIGAVPALAGVAAAFAFASVPATSALAAPTPPRHSVATPAAVPLPGATAARLAAFTKRAAKHAAARPARYTVKSGDTLSSIAVHFYKNPGFWPVLYWANHSRIRYANVIEAGQVLVIPAKPAKIPGPPSAVGPAPVSVPAQASTSVPAYAAAQQAAPAQSASTYNGAGGSFQSCVIASESGGNSQVMNGSGHYGLYQFSSSTWGEYGGNPADFGNASAAEQNQVFENAMAAGGASNWAPYDGC
jgi:LysM repeat protein